MGEPEETMQLYVQDDFKLQKAPANFINCINTTGTLYISQKLNSPERIRYIEWKPNDLTMEPDAQENDWTVVRAHCSSSRPRTFSSGDNGSGGSCPSNGVAASLQQNRYLRLNMREIRSFKVWHNNQRIEYLDGKGDTLCGFYCPKHNCSGLVTEMRNLLPTTISKRDKRIYVVLDDVEESNLKKSFADIDLFPDENPMFLYNIVRNFQRNPYGATMQTFAKIGDLMTYKSPEAGMAAPDLLAPDYTDALRRSLTDLDVNNVTTTGTHGEYELVGHAPKLPERKNYPRGNPLNETQWFSLQDSEGRIEDVESLKLVIFHGGVISSLRPVIWKYLLGYFPWDSTHSEQARITMDRQDDYRRMREQWRTICGSQEERFADYRERKSLIEKDVNRTDRTMDFYAGDGNNNLKKLYNILMTYVMYNFDLGYVQGMSDLLSPLLYLLKDEVTAFWCFVGFMDKVCSNFDIDQCGMKEQLNNLHTLLAFVDPELANYLDQHESGNMFFCFRWLLVWFKRELSLEDVMNLWEVLWTGLPCTNFHLLICVSILETEKWSLIANNYGFTEILKHINELSTKIDLSSALNRAEGIYHQIEQAEHLTNPIRLILGLPLVGEPSSASVKSDDVTNSNESSTCTDAIVGSPPTIVNAWTDSEGREPQTRSFTTVNYQNEEVVFDRGLELNFA